MTKETNEVILERLNNHIGRHNEDIGQLRSYANANSRRTRDLKQRLEAQSGQIESRLSKLEHTLQGINFKFALLGAGIMLAINLAKELYFNAV